MRILQVVQRFPPAVGGGEEVVYEISKELVKRGHEVTVATSNWLSDDDVPGFSSTRVNLRSRSTSLPPDEMVDGIRVCRFRPRFRFWTFTANPSLLRFLRHKIVEFDVVNAHYYLFVESVLAAMFARAKSKPFVITLHSSFSLPNVYPKSYKVGKKVYDSTIGNFILRAATRILTVSPQIKNELIEYGVDPSRVVVVENGIDVGRFSRVSNTRGNINSGRTKTVLFVGRLEKQKGPQYLIMAIPEICRRFPDTRFIFVGEDRGYYSALMALGRKLNVAQKCAFTGPLDLEHLASIYASADVLVLPAVGEGFGLVALESIYSGLPTVLANADALGRILQEFGGYGLDMSGDVPRQIADHVSKILANGHGDDNLIVTRRKIENGYSWPSIARKLEEVYSEAVGI